MGVRRDRLVLVRLGSGAVRIRFKRCVCPGTRCFPREADDGTHRPDTNLVAQRDRPRTRLDRGGSVRRPQQEPRLAISGTAADILQSARARRAIYHVNELRRAREPARRDHQLVVPRQADEPRRHHVSDERRRRPREGSTTETDPQLPAQPDVDASALLRPAARLVGLLRPRPLRPRERHPGHPAVRLEAIRSGPVSGGRH